MRKPSRSQLPESESVLQLEDFQRNAWQALCGPETHVLLYGGARSGKTQLVILWLVLRALAKPAATHAVLRYRFNHLKTSIIFDTLPDVCERNWPGKKLYSLNKSDWYAEFVGGGRVYFGGLDDKERTEKILGQGHSTIYLNEASQISYSARLKAVTRLSQNRGLRLKEVCDENPPIVGHWTERLWVKGVNPVGGAPVANRAQYTVARMNPADNPHIPEATKEILRALPPRERLRFWEGQFGSSTSNPLWTYDSIEAARVPAAPGGMRIGIVLDPSGCAGPEDTRSDEVGISVVGAVGGVVYVLEDASGHFGPSGEDGWGAIAIRLFHKWGADFIAAERNFGGAMVAAVIRTAKAKINGTEYEGASIPFHEITASSGKHVRAEPVGTLTDVGRLKFVDGGADSFPFPELKEQLVAFSTAGYTGDKSPDRADAMVHGAYALGVVAMPGQGILDYYEGLAKQSATKRGEDRQAIAPVDESPALVSLHVRDGLHGTFTTRKGRPYSIEAGLVHVVADDVEDLLGLGFRRAAAT